MNVATGNIEFGNSYYIITIEERLLLRVKLTTWVILQVKLIKVNEKLQITECLICSLMIITRVRL